MWRKRDLKISLLGLARKLKIAWEDRQVSPTEAQQAATKSGALFMGLVIGLGTFWNGALVIAALLVLGAAFLLLKQRIPLLIVGGTAVILALLQSSYFISPGASFVPRFFFGFLAESPGLIDVAVYYLKLFGVLIPVIASFFLRSRLQMRLFILAILTPILFATLFKMSPIVAVNHKFVNASLKILAVVSAIYVMHIWRLNRLGQAAAVILVLLLSSTGVIDLISLWNKNSSKQFHHMNDPLAVWVIDNTDKKAVLAFKPTYHQVLYLTGRPAYLGQLGWVQSATYDPEPRLKALKKIYEGSDVESVRKTMLEEGIDYILVDDDVRKSFSRLNEVNLRLALRVAYADRDRILFSRQQLMP